MLKLKLAGLALLGLILSGVPTDAQDQIKEVARALVKAQRAFMEAGIAGNKAQQDIIADGIRKMEAALKDMVFHPPEVDDDPKVKAALAVIRNASAAWYNVSWAQAGQVTIGAVDDGLRAANGAYMKELDRARAEYAQKAVQEAADALDQTPARSVDTKVQMPQLGKDEVFNRETQKPKKKAQERKAKKTTAPPSSLRRAPAVPRQAGQQPIGRLESGAGGGH